MGTSPVGLCWLSLLQSCGVGLVLRGTGDLQAARVASDRRSTQERVPRCFHPGVM